MWHSTHLFLGIISNPKMMVKYEPTYIGALRMSRSVTKTWQSQNCWFLPIFDVAEKRGFVGKIFGFFLDVWINELLQRGWYEIMLKYLTDWINNSLISQHLFPHWKQLTMLLHVHFINLLRWNILFRRLLSRKGIDRSMRTRTVEEYWVKKPLNQSRNFFLLHWGVDVV